MFSTLRVACIISGGGSTMEAIVRSTRKKGRLHSKVTVPLVISTRVAASGIKRARENDVPHIETLLRSDWTSEETYGHTLKNLLLCHGIDLVGLYGCLTKIPERVFETFKGRIVNQHPGALDPGYADFGGQGMYGMRVHCAGLLFARHAFVQDDLRHQIEVTAHRVIKEYDKGEILDSIEIPILPDDTPAALAERARGEEHKLQIRVLRAFADGAIKEKFRKERLIAEHQKPLLAQAKATAFILFPNG